MNKPCSLDNWREVPKNKFYCIVHKVTFDVEKSCPLGTTPHTPIAHGNTNLQSSPHTPPPYDFNLLTSRQQQALKLFNDGNSLQTIATLLKIKKCTAQDLIKRATKKYTSAYHTAKPTPHTPPIRPLFPMETITPMHVRLHNDEFKLKIVGDYNNIVGDIKNKGGNLEYKLLKLDYLFIKIHKNNTLTVRFLQDICAPTEKECKALADKRLNDWLNTFSIVGASLVFNSKLINRHYGLIGSSFAKHVTDNSKLFIVRDIDGSIRLRIDLSQGAEIDAEHVEKGLVDMFETREFFNDLINAPHYTPSDTKNKIDIHEKKLDYVVDIMNNYAVNMAKHIEVMDEISKGINNLNNSILKSDVSRGRKLKPTNKRNSKRAPLSSSKNDRAKQLLKQWGW